MKKSETKKCHFVPGKYLKNFAINRNDDFYINMLNKKEHSDKISESNISDICTENHLLKLDGNDKSKQNLEDIYSDIFENQYDILFSVLTDNAVLEITDEIKKLIVSAVITMFYKTKKWSDLLGYHADENIIKIDQLRNQFKVDHYFNSKGAQVGFQNRTLEELEISHKSITRIPLIITQLKVALKLIEAKQFDCINVYKIADESEFITSDNPVLAINMHKMRTMHFDIENAYYMPISNKYLIAIFPKEELPPQNKIIRLMINKEWVDSFNAMQLFHSDWFIIGSAAAIKNTMGIQ